RQSFNCGSDLREPDSKTVLAHLVPLSAYPGQASALSHLGLEAALQDATLDSSASDSAASSARSIRLTPTPRWATEYRRLPVGYPDIHPDTLAVLIRPRQRAHLPVTFRPTESGEFRALFLLRNNLTGVDAAAGRRPRPQELNCAPAPTAWSSAWPEPPASSRRVSGCLLASGRQLTIVNPGPLTVDSGPPIVGRDASGCSDAGFMVAPCAADPLGAERVAAHGRDLHARPLPAGVQLGSFAWSAALFGVVLRGGLTPTQVAALLRPACLGRLPIPLRLPQQRRRQRPQTEQSASKSTPSVVAVPDRSADSGLFSRLTAWLPCWWRRQRRAGRAGGAADGSLSVGGSSARGQASVGRHVPLPRPPGQVSGCSRRRHRQQLRLVSRLPTFAQVSNGSRCFAVNAVAVFNVGGCWLASFEAAAIRTPQFEPIAFPQIDRRGKPLPTKSKPSASKSQQQKAAPDLSGQQPSLAANGGRKASAGAAGQDQLRRQQQRQVQQHQEDCSTSSSNGSASDASSWETAGSAFQRVGAGNQRSVKAASSGFGSLAQQAQQQQQSAAVPTVSVRAVPLQPLQCKQQPKTSVVKPMMTHPRLRRGKALRTCIDESARQQQQQQRQQQQQLH
uniref:Peptidase_S8 domain-containing protein n=1 Tax=Macrostomum lignano TaxID=282301 RepID=A0A1I8IUP5_9PLAT